MAEPDYAPLLERIEEEVRQLPEEWQKGLLPGVRARKQWDDITKEYPVLKDKIGSEKAWRELAEKYRHSEGYIKKILYEMNPYR